MVNFVRCGHTFSNQGLRFPARSDIPHLPVKKPMSTDGDTIAKKLIYRPIPQKGRNTKDWMVIAWPTNIQSRTPDGKFGPARMMDGWSDCWFLAVLAAVANDPEGHNLLAGSIKKASVEGIDGYHVTFAGLPNNPAFISDQALDNCLDTNGGDADTRLVELAADRVFSVNGNFKSLFIAALLNKGLNQATVKKCLQQFCHSNDVQDPMTFNPMLDGGHDSFAFFLFTGMNPERLITTQAAPLQRSEIMGYLNRYVTNDRDGASIVINSKNNPLGDSDDSKDLVLDWDVIRTDITRDERFRKQGRAFLNALNKWLETPDDNTLQALRSAAGSLRLEHIKPIDFVDLLDSDQISLRQNHRDMLRSAVQEVFGGGTGYIGLPGEHCGNLEEINEAANTFSYSEPNYPTVVHTGELSGLMQAIRSRNVWLSALEPTTGQDDRKRFEHAGTSTGRHLRQIHNQVIRDGKIDQAESRPLANLIEMDAGAFRQVYDRDQNGVIEGSELKAVKMRVDRWVEHLELTPIW